MIPIFQKGDRKNYRNRYSLTPAMRYILKCYILNCTDPTFCLKLLIEKRREYNVETHLLCIDYKKAFDSTQRQILSYILKL